MPGLERPAADAPARPGLSGADVAARVQAGLDNRAPEGSGRSLWQIFRANVLTLFNAIVAGCFALLLLLGHWRDALFGTAVVGNAVIGVVQEYRAKRSLDKLAVLGSPQARVLRDGVAVDIALAQIVLDDILVLQAGDQVGADAAVLEGEGLQADESLLTGESEPVAKRPGLEVLSGSGIVAGHGLARVVRVGHSSFANRLTAEARRFSLVNSEIRASLNRVLRWISWILLPVTFLVLNGEVQAAGGWPRALDSGTWRGAAVGTIASVIAMIPLALVFLANVAFAVSGMRLARENVLVQELAAVEVLARVDVFCVDKTGTLTEGRLTFDAVHPAGGPAPPGWERALAWFGGAAGANATARCLAEAFDDDGGGRPVSTVTFSSARKWSAASFAEGHEAAGTWVLGAPEVVLAAPAPGTAPALAAAAALAASGLRTLVLAHTPGMLPARNTDEAQLPANPFPAVLLTFREKVRPDAARTLAYFRQQGVLLKVISGDDPRTAASVARQAGLDADCGYDARQLPADPDLMAEVLEAGTVFGRVTPAQKKDMVLSLQRHGHTVAMTGDGVNDALALKEADIGIAMGSAAAATRAVSRIVLLDGRFDRLPGLVAEGRRVIGNIERISKLFFAKTTYALVLSITFGALLLGFPFLPRQLAALDGLTIGLPAFILALLPGARRYRRGFLTRSLSFAAPAGMIVAGAVAAVYLYSGLAGGYSPADTRTAAVIALALVALWILLAVSRPLNLPRAATIGAMYAGLGIMLAAPALRDFFALPWPPPALVVMALGTGAGGSLAVELLIRAHNRRYRHE